MGQVLFLEGCWFDGFAGLDQAFFLLFSKLLVAAKLGETSLFLYFELLVVWWGGEFLVFL